MMDKFPLLREGKTVGELTVEREQLYTWFEARCRPLDETLWCAWAVGDLGEIRLGVLEPCGGFSGGRSARSTRRSRGTGNP